MAEYGFSVTVFSRIRIKSKVIRKIRVRENPYSGVFHTV